MNEDTSPERTITVTLTEMEFGALAGAISKAMDHWRGVGGEANWLNAVSYTHLTLPTKA